MSAGRGPADPSAKNIWCDAKDHARPRKYLEQNIFSKRGVQVELGCEAPPGADQLQQLVPGQAIGDDRQGRGGLPGASFNEGAKHPLTRVLIEPWAEQPQRVYEGIQAAQPIEPPLVIGPDPAGGHQYSSASMMVSTRVVTLGSAGCGGAPLSAGTRESILKKMRLPSIVRAPKSCSP